MDILAFGAHPDDVELGCSGTLIKHIKQGKKIGIIDLTQGELGTRGSAEIRLQEAERAREIIGAELRHNLGFKDGFFENNHSNQLEIIKIIRQYRPSIVLANAPTDRHPDHGRAANLVSQAMFLAGLPKIKTFWNNVEQEAYRPKLMLHYIQFQYLQPNLLIDISDEIEQKMLCIKAYQTQFFNENNNQQKEPQTLISTSQFLESIKGRDLIFGQYIGVNYAEGFVANRLLGIKSLDALL